MRMLGIMVRISSVEQGHQHVKLHPTTTQCFAQVVTAPDGEQLLHISTFGSSSRVSAAKSSQSMQFDLNTGAALVSALVGVCGSAVLPTGHLHE